MDNENIEYITKNLLSQIYKKNILNIEEIYKYIPQNRYIFKFNIFSNFYVIRLVKDELNMTRINTINCMNIARKCLNDIIPKIYYNGYYSNYDYIIMDYIEGTLLCNIWNDINIDNKDKINQQLSMIIKKIRKIEFENIGSITFVDDDKIKYGPITDYNIIEGKNIDKWNRGPFTNIEDWLISGLLLELDNINNRNIILKVSNLINYLKKDHNLFDNKSIKFVLSHGDFDIWNIIIDENFNIKGIIDWEYSGSYPDYYEYIKRDLIKSDIKDLFKISIDKNLLEIEYIKQNIHKNEDEIIKKIDYLLK